MSPLRPPTSKWRPPANADLMKHGAASDDAPPGAVSVLRPSWWRRLRRRVTTLVVFLVIGAGVGTYLAGGVDSTASLLLSKEMSNAPGGATLRKLALTVMAHRPVTPQIQMQLVRLAHMLEPGDPLFPAVVSTASTLLGQPMPQGDAPTVLAALDAATARAISKPLTPEGVLAWRAIDPYFVLGIDQLAGADASAGAERFNSYRTPDGLPSAEWYLDELVRGFGDLRPLPFVLVADSTGDDWRPVALPPDKVPAHARRIKATTVGQALQVGLWGLEDYRPATPDADIATWWAGVASLRGLPTFTTR